MDLFAVRANPTPPPVPRLPVGERAVQPPASWRRRVSPVPTAAGKRVLSGLANVHCAPVSPWGASGCCRLGGVSGGLPPYGNAHRGRHAGGHWVMTGTHLPTIILDRGKENLQNYLL